MKRDNSYLVGNKFAVGSGPNHTSFKKGQKPWNTGIKKLVSEKCLKTTFKKGQRPTNFTPNGTVTVRTDKQKRKRQWIKVKGKWIIYSQWLWIKTHGEIPAGLLIHHLDGDTLNDTLSNYALVTRAQHINLHRADLRK